MLIDTDANDTDNDNKHHMMDRAWLHRLITKWAKKLMKRQLLCCRMMGHLERVFLNQNALSSEMHDFNVSQKHGKFIDCFGADTYEYSEKQNRK